MNEPQISVVICTHNGATHLPKTLGHLAAQRVDQTLRWELVVIDNGSTDGTADVTREIWPKAPPAPLRIISEPMLGLTNARHRGLREAHGELICFVDDDTWLDPNWLQIGWELMAANPRIGALGGVNEAACEVEPPWWFKDYQCMLAITPENAFMEDVTETGVVLVGAGLILRREAWDSLTRRGFRISIEGRTGGNMASGEDWEICLALRFAGWRLYREPRMRLKHCLPSRRLDWQYARRLYRGCGQGSIQLDPYLFFFGALEETWKNSFRRTWQWHCLAAFTRLMRHPWRLCRFPFSPMEGDQVVCEMEMDVGRILGYWQHRSRYTAMHERIQKIFADVFETAQAAGQKKCVPSLEG